ncbi:hypothetical protein BKA69DRAFT_1108764 [Paraphysoderma sedebokerense]|nr:hypothetical protein BKA69DRAFT_1108764 [Paraphysoderma sedebokerense]
MATTRLDRLINLLDTGSTIHIRSTAAQQIGETAKQCKTPRELYKLLERIIPYLHSKHWDTRIAAGQAIENIAKNVPVWDPPRPPPSRPEGEEEKVNSRLKEKQANWMKFEEFDVGSVLKHGKVLLGSKGKEYDVDYGDLDPRERLALQKKNLRQRLGMGSQFMDELEKLKMLIHIFSYVLRIAVDLIDDEDLMTVSKSTAKQISGLPPSQPAEVNMAGLSAREKNKLKRKLKMAAKAEKYGAKRGISLTLPKSTSTSKGTPSPALTPTASTAQNRSMSLPSVAVKREAADDESEFEEEEEEEIMCSSEPAFKKIKTEPSSMSLDVKAEVKVEPKEEDNKVVVEFKGPKPEEEEDSVDDDLAMTEWPFERLCEVLCVYLFDPQWEVRHGSAIGLREVLKVHGSGSGKLVGLTPAINEMVHRQWLEDVSIRILCVFALDRFGDFVGDTVVAPVREMCAQALGALLTHMTPPHVSKVQSCLLQLVSFSSPPVKSPASSIPTGRDLWEVKHAGLLGLKYVIAVRKDLVSTLLPSAYPAIVQGLQDQDDDVRHVSSGTLLPITEEFIAILPNSLNQMLRVLWDSLLTLDDLTASTGTVMDLLAKFCHFDQVTKFMLESDDKQPSFNLPKVVPRLYAFFRHSLTSVRMAVLRVVKAFVDASYRRLVSESQNNTAWITAPVVRYIFQNFLVEEKKQVLELSLELWVALVNLLSKAGGLGKLLQPIFPGMLELVMTPIGSPLNTKLLIGSVAARRTNGNGVMSGPTSKTKKSKMPNDSTGEIKREDDDVDSANLTNLDSAMVDQDLSLVSVEDVMRGRLAAGKAIGSVLEHWADEVCFLIFIIAFYQLVLMSIILSLQDLQTMQSFLMRYLSAPWALQSQLSSVIIEDYAVAKCASISNTQLSPPVTAFHQSLYNELMRFLESSTEIAYNELSTVLTRMRGECQALFNDFVASGIPASKIPPLPPSFSISQATSVTTSVFNDLIPSLPSPTKETLESLKDRQRRIVASIAYFQTTKNVFDVRVNAAMAGAVVGLRILPSKLNPVIRSIMNSVKFEESVEIQKRSAVELTLLIQFCADRGPNPNDKIVKNLSAFLCSDPTVTWLIQKNPSKDAILSLVLLEAQNKQAENGSIKGAKKKIDTPAVVESVGFGVEIPNEQDESVQAAKLVRRGAEMTFEEMAQRFGAKLFDLAPKVWDCLSSGLIGVFGEDPKIPEPYPPPQEDIQSLIDSLQVITTITPHIDRSLHSRLTTLLPYIVLSLQSPYSVVRNMAAKALASCCKTFTVETMNIVIERVLPLLSDPKNVANRMGATEAIFHLIQHLDTEILPYIIFLIVPILGRMSDPVDPLRRLITNCFASLIKLVPLEQGIPDPPGIAPELIKQRETERKFLSQLLGSGEVEGFQIPVKINAELRKYQQEGVNWLMFLNRYHLHGILCDDMGLGKTLQTICIVASSHFLRAEKYKETKLPEFVHCPSLVVCPSTLTGHWYHEILKYTDVLRPITYTGSVMERGSLRPKLRTHDVVITSYEVLRNDIDILQAIEWNYCVLDEGHIIRNAKTKITKAAKSIKANHRLLLSGTPIQNNVLELWSLFDFLMPGFLGTEKQFNERFSKPILASRDAKKSSKQQEAGALALEALHRQVLPFLLRRLKEDVLHDLPPKIIQDYYCELSDLQSQLYQDFAKTNMSTVENDLSETEAKGKTHVFQALQYLRKLCNHPLLVLNQEHPKYTEITGKMSKSGGNIRDVENAPKLLALKQLLNDCGIGTTSDEADTKDSVLSTSTVSQHRALIFCQLKTMLDIIETDLFKKHMPNVSFMRLDGSTDPNKRHEVVMKFNDDPSIDVLLLTTHVGGLGLNLTGADTVIFVEHDWNPMKDLQAMDRAHRIGQKKVVNVYRLITRGTLEEKIMGLQKFKLNIANQIVNQQNSSLTTMDTDQILDLFSVSSTPSDREKQKAKDKNKKVGGAKAALEGLSELWDEKEYEEEYNLDEFIKTLK